MTRRISAVALCCSVPSINARRSSAYGTPRGPLSLVLLSGTPHARQNLACDGLSCWHRGHVMPEPPSGRGGERSERWAETNRPRLAWSRTSGHARKPAGMLFARKALWQSPRPSAALALANEEKLDGWRVMAYKSGANVRLVSRLGSTIP